MHDHRQCMCTCHIGLNTTAIERHWHVVSIELEDPQVARAGGRGAAIGQATGGEIHRRGLGAA